MADASTAPPDYSEGMPRNEWDLARRNRYLAGLDLKRLSGLEIGALNRPAVRKSESDVLYVDHADVDVLRANYSHDAGVPPDSILPVDVIWGGKQLRDCFPDGRTFDYVVASHVIEHVPNVIGWLNELASVLKPGGLLYLAIPDRRRTFDIYRRTSSMAEFVNAYVTKAKRPSPQQIFDQHVHFAKDESAVIKDEHNVGAALSGPRLKEGLGMAQIVADSDVYVDCHCWVFTPASLLEIFAGFSAMGVLPFRLGSFTPPWQGEHEMFMVLERADLPEEADRVAAMGAFREALRALPPEALANDYPSFAAVLANFSGDFARGPAPDAPPPPPVPLQQRAPASAMTPTGWWTDRIRNRLMPPSPQPLARTPSSVPSVAQAGVIAAWQPIYAYTTPFVDEGHRAITEIKTLGGLLRADIDGYLRPADALAIYEAAHFAQGDIIEFGSAWGLSTSFLCEAAINARRGRRVYSVEIDPNFQQITRKHIVERRLEACHAVLPGEASAMAASMISRGKKMGFAFVDFDPGLDANRAFVAQLPQLMRKGSLIIFHDFNDARNRDPKVCSVHQAVSEFCARPDVEYLGVAGCCAVTRLKP